MWKGPRDLCPDTADLLLQFAEKSSKVGMLTSARHSAVLVEKLCCGGCRGGHCPRDLPKAEGWLTFSRHSLGIAADWPQDMPEMLPKYGMLSSSRHSFGKLVLPSCRLDAPDTPQHDGALMSSKQQLGRVGGRRRRELDARTPPKDGIDTSSKHSLAIGSIEEWANEGADSSQRLWDGPDRRERLVPRE